MYASTRLSTMTVPIVVNTAGTLLNLSFLACYMYFANGKVLLDARRQFVSLLIVTLVAIASWIISGSNEGVGYVAMVVNVMMLYGPLAAAGEVIRTRSTSTLPLMPLVWTLIASSLWFSYGVYIRELPVYIPNALGVIFGILQISLYAWARRHELKKTDDDTGIISSLL